MAEAKTFTRLQLYELVWKRPLRDVARDLGISDVALGKACRRHAIPLPGRGYWAKIAAGHKLTPIPLPASHNVKSHISFTPIDPPPPPAPLPEVPNQLKEHLERPIVLSALDAPHSLVKQLQRQLQKRTADVYGLRSAGSERGCSVTVSSACEKRALAILDTLLQRLVDVGAYVNERSRVNYREPDRYLVLDGEEIHIQIREAYRQQRKSEAELEQERKAGEVWPRKYRFFPKGLLTIAITNYPRHQAAVWSDGKQLVEEILPEILGAALALPDLLKEEKRKAREAELARLEQERQQSDARRQFERRQQCLADLLGEAQRWQQHAALISYLDELEKRAEQYPDLMTGAYREGVAVARELADYLLPFDERIKRLAEIGMVPNREIEQPWLRMPALTKS